MVNQSATDITIDHGDGYQQSYNVYYDDADGAVPIVIVYGGSGTNKDSAAVVSNAQSLRDAGFFAVTIDFRGVNAGKTWIEANSSAANYGFEWYSDRDIADVGAVWRAVRDAYPSNTTDKLGIVGGSRGANFAIMVAEAGGSTLHGIKMPKVHAVHCEAFAPVYARQLVPESRAEGGNKRYGRRFGGRTWGLFADISAFKILKTGSNVALQDALEDLDTDEFLRLLREGSDNEPKSLHSRVNAGLTVPRDTPVLYTYSNDDRWGVPDILVEAAEKYPNVFLYIGANGNHGATEVSGESTKVLNRREVFMRKFLKGEDVFATTFSDSDPTIAAKVTMLTTPNNATDYADEDGGPYTDNTYSWAELTVERPSWLKRFGDPDFTGDQSVQAGFYLAGSGTGSPTIPADGNQTVSHTWGTATTGSDLRTWVEAGNDHNDFDSYLSGRLTASTVNYQVNWGAGSEGSYCGFGTLLLYASASATDAHIYGRLQHSQDAGVTWVTVADTWHFWDEHYTPNTIELLKLRFTLRAMHLPGSANGRFRLQLTNYPTIEYDWVDGLTPLRFMPSMNDSTVTVYHGTTYPSQVVLPMHADTVSELYP